MVQVDLVDRKALQHVTVSLAVDEGSCSLIEELPKLTLWEHLLDGLLVSIVLFEGLLREVNHGVYHEPVTTQSVILVEVGLLDVNNVRVAVL